MNQKKFYSNLSLKQKVDTSASTQGNEKAIISSLHMSMPHLMNYTAAITHWETPRKAGTGWACVSALSPSLLSLSAWGFGYSPLGSPHFHCACSARRLPVTQHCQQCRPARGSREHSDCKGDAKSSAHKSLVLFSEEGYTLQHHLYLTHNNPSMSVCLQTKQQRPLR